MGVVQLSLGILGEFGDFRRLARMEISCGGDLGHMTDPIVILNM